MKTAVGLLCLGGFAALLGFTNPSPKSYRTYAVDTLSDYSKVNVCLDKSLNKFLQNQCVALIDTAMPEVGNVIDSTTERQNYVLFSLYKTNLAISPLMPSFHFESVGVLNSFYTYRHEKR